MFGRRKIIIDVIALSQCVDPDGFVVGPLFVDNPVFFEAYRPKTG